MNFFFRPTEIATARSQLDSMRRYNILSICLKNQEGRQYPQVQLLQSRSKMIPLREVLGAVTLESLEAIDLPRATAD
jgi:hypothetical protein